MAIDIERMKIKRQDGKKCVTLEEDKYGITMSVMMNGWQSIVCEVDQEIIAMLAQCIDEYAENRGGLTWREFLEAKDSEKLNAPAPDTPGWKKI